MQLDLFQVELDGLPWAGQSPRVLTSAYKRFILKPEAQKRERFVIDLCQLNMFQEATTGAPHQYGGSPSLLPLPKRIL